MTSTLTDARAGPPGLTWIAAAACLDRMSLLILLAVIGLRPLIAEQYASGESSLTRAIGLISDPSPIATLALDAAILASWILMFAARACGGGRPFRRTGAEWGLLMVAVAAAVSCTLAGNKRLAVNGALDWICCGSLLPLLAQQLATRRRVQLALGVILASGAAQAVECVHQRFWVFPETEAMYAAERDAIWRRQGIALDSPEVALYEARMRSQEASGYLAHSNVAGAHLMTAMIVAVGCTLGRRCAPHPTVRRGAIGSAMLAGLMGAGVVLTRGRGVLVAGAAALAALAARIRWRPCNGRNADRVRRNVGLMIVAGVLGVVGYGLWFDTLPGRSLEFRWRYWTASAHVFADHPLTGVGSGNFGRHYLRYKSVVSPEEVQNPHNFLVAAAVDWGVGGALGVVAVVYGLFKGIVRTEVIPVMNPEAERDDEWRLRWFRGLILAAAVFAPRTALLGSSDANYVYFATVLPLLAWLGAFAVAVSRSVGEWSIVRDGIGIALIAFLVQDSINFASLTPGTLTTAFALAGTIMAIHGVPGAPPARPRILPSVCAAGIAFAVLTTLVLAVARPVHRSDRAMRAARNATSLHQAVALFDLAAAADRWDARPLLECGRLLLESASSGDPVPALDGAITRLATAIGRDPEHVAIHVLKSRGHLARAAQAGVTADYGAAVASAEQAVALYPTDPAQHVWLGECLLAKGRADAQSSTVQRAVGAYREALRLDAARPAWEVIRRLTTAQRSAIETQAALAERDAAAFADESP